MRSVPEKTILVVDDEPAVLGLLNTALGVLGYRVLLAGGPRDAIGVFHRASTVDLLLSDVNMPEMDGGALAAYLVQRNPGLHVLLMTGAVRASGSASTAHSPVLRKPLCMKTLGCIVNGMLKGYIAGAAC